MKKLRQGYFDRKKTNRLIISRNYEHRI